MGTSINLSQVGNKLSPDDARWHQENVADLLNRRKLGFPGAQPVSFAGRHLEELERVDYFLCEKTDGIRCLLYQTSFRNEENKDIEIQFLIDRKNEYYCIPMGRLHLPAPSSRPPGFDVHSFWQRTLMDGELVVQTRPGGERKLVYFIFDLLAVNGENIMGKPLSKRYARAQQLYSTYKRYAEHPDYRQDVRDWQPFELQLKKMETPYAAEMMFRDKIPNLQHGNDGLIFTCVVTPYVSGTDQHILKWKPPHENTIDFRLVIAQFPMEVDEDGEEYEDWDRLPSVHLYVNHGGRYEHYANLAITETEWEAIKGMNQMIDGRVIECYRDAETGEWRPKLEADGTPRFRDDKTDANHISVVESVLESIHDAVTAQDLINAAGRIKAAYKVRQKNELAAQKHEQQKLEQQKIEQTVR
ncbi:mRNA-capping enzyme subunit alpha [Piedraia hortae CBS 480.64]|uniref:mRNA-capping enzyme subunit alpha n=1 Tax=Piedraia hortae CBS 480.64 TaxID=1314780 RepID=A0A6A7C594_9PEZI|nr:mRNA-capping enzyme subunit alpha [Piedraia hortae CBS 480.64]